MHEDRTQNYDQKVTRNILYMIHPSSRTSFIVSHVQTTEWPKNGTVFFLRLNFIKY